MVSCNACDEICVDFVTCGTCNGSFHYGCAGIMESIYRKWKPEKQQAWRCSVACRSKSTLTVSTHNSPKLNCNLSNSQNTTSHIDSPSNLPNFHYDIANPTIEGMSNKLSELCACVSDLVHTIKYQSTQFDDVMRTMAEQEKHLVEHDKIIHVQKKIIADLEEENKKLTNQLENVRQEITDLNQYGRNRNIEIHGIQERNGEDLKSLVHDTAKLLQIPCTLESIDVVHRLPQSNGSKRRPIIVQFTTRAVRNEWLKKRRTGLISNNLVKGSDDQPLFVNVNLAPFKKELFWKARMAKRSLNYKFCWVNANGDIYMKKNEDTSPIQIRNENDIPINNAPKNRSEQK